MQLVSLLLGVHFLFPAESESVTSSPSFNNDTMTLAVRMQSLLEEMKQHGQEMHAFYQAQTEKRRGARKSLLSILELEAKKIRSRFPKGMDFTSPHVRYFGTHERALQSQSALRPSVPLTTALTESFLGLRETPFTFGFTGGSATAGLEAYPALIATWFRQRLNMSVEVRNGAQGATSQLETSGCIYQIVGDKTDYGSNTSRVRHSNTTSYLQGSPVDLLVWEFELNDEQGVYVDDAAIRIHSRKVAVEAYVRSAFASRHVPLAIGFVHLWDGSAPQLSTNWDQPVPDASWKPTNELLSYYSSDMDAFAINVIRFIFGQKCVHPNTSSILVPPPADCVSACPKCSARQLRERYFRDRSHPNARGYETTRDLFVHSLLELWIAALQSELANSTEATIPTEVLGEPSVNLLARPYFIPNHILPIMPGMHAACIVGVQPMMAPPDPHLLLNCERKHNESQFPANDVSFIGASSDPSGFHHICPADPRSGWGRHDPNRADRKIPWSLPRNCAQNPSEKHWPVYFNGMRRLRYLIVQCAGVQDCAGLNVEWAGRPLIPNVNTTSTMYGYGLSWMYKFSESDNQAQPSFLQLSDCPSNPSARPLLVMRLIVWYED